MLNNNLDIKFVSVPDFAQFETIRKHIMQFELDARQLDAKDFLTAVSNQNIIGFGRLRKHEACCELCSLGVIQPERFKGTGKLLVNKLIETAFKPLYLVCVIPEYFKPLGFTEVINYPAPVLEKLEYCNTHLAVEQSYVVMQYHN